VNQTPRTIRSTIIVIASRGLALTGTQPHGHVLLGSTSAAVAAVGCRRVFGGVGDAIGVGRHRDFDAAKRDAEHGDDSDHDSFHGYLQLCGDGLQVTPRELTRVAPVRPAREMNVPPDRETATKKLLNLPKLDETAGSALNLFASPPLANEGAHAFHDRRRPSA
jgi:hypothetical protein